ncbi:MAG: LamG domain-containing protein [Roseivirga sp.]|nr:LamG domain-containing protein [Roseivirga sp.]
MKNSGILTSLLLLALLTFSCQSDRSAYLKESLTLYASFDQGTEADYALGDNKLYSAPSRREPDKVIEGLDNEIHQIIKGAGKQGDALRFTKRNPRVAFYKSKDNIAYNAQSWSGTISFWLRVDPENELEPGFTDPIQITDVAYNDASIWVDFTRDEPRQFRLGVIGDKVSWEQDTVLTSATEEFNKRLAVVDKPPFTKETWTHVAITYAALGTAEATYSLYLDGKNKGTVNGHDDPFTWELENSNIYLGLSFVGLIDELSIFNKPFSPEQITELYSLEGGIRSIL